MDKYSVTSSANATFYRQPT